MDAVEGLDAVNILERLHEWALYHCGATRLDIDILRLRRAIARTEATLRSHCPCCECAEVYELEGKILRQKVMLTALEARREKRR